MKSSEDESNYRIKGYNLESCFSSSSYTGGCSIYIKNNITYRVILNDSVGLNWIIGLKIMKGYVKGNYSVVYHSPSSSNNDFCELLNQNWLRKIHDKKFSMVVGDFNINWNDKIESKVLNNTMLQYDLKQKCKNITRYSKTNKKIIDLVFSNENVKVDTNSNWKISDHETLIISNLSDTKHIETNEKYISDWTNYSKDNIQGYLTQNMMNMTFDMDLNTQCENLIHSLTNGINNIVTKRKLENPDKISNSNLLCSMKRKRDIALRKARYTNCDTNWREYKKLRNMYSKQLKINDKKDIDKKIENGRNDPKKLWTVMNSLIKPEQNKQHIVVFDNEEITEPMEIANRFNDYFVKSIAEINESIELESEPIELRMMESSTSKLNKFLPIGLQELRQIVFELPNKSAMDDISAKILQDSFDVIGEKLLFILNSSIVTGNVPDCLKKSVVIPIEKIANSNKCENMRPINMLSNIDKILEIIIKKQLVEYLEKNKKIIKEQSGFREKHSCESALIFLFQKWKETLDKKESVLAVFLDLKRAFETISRFELLKVVQRMGISGVALKWIKSYLENRTQCTKYNGVKSNNIMVDLGVPQGSVLGPILFIMYINDIKIILKNSHVNLFADDTVIYCSGQNIDDVVNKLNTDLFKLQKWLNYKKLKLNISKTKSMLITLKNDTFNDSIKVGEDIIESVSCLKYLGVMIDSRLNFNEHLDTIIKKISSKFGVIYRIRKSLSFFAKITLYQALIEPHFIYCSSVLFMSNQNKLQELQVLQNKFMRLLLGCDYMTRSNQMAIKLGWLKVKNKINYNVNLFVHKIKCGYLPEYLKEFMIPGNSIHNYNTRGNSDIRIQSSRLTLSYNSVFSKGLTMYNNLPNEIKNETSIHIFKRKLNEYYFRKQQ